MGSPASAIAPPIDSRQHRLLAIDLPPGAAASIRRMSDRGSVAGPLRVSRSIVIPERELKWRFSRSSGPGGQSVNTADSRVELTLDIATTTALGPVQRARALERLADRLVEGALTVSAQEERSQLRNREIARGRLADVLAAAVAPPPPRRRPTRATRASTERRLAEKRRRAKIKRLRRPDDD